jgi:hypothetical protein
MHSQGCMSIEFIRLCTFFPCDFLSVDIAAAVGGFHFCREINIPSFFAVEALNRLM